MIALGPKCYTCWNNNGIPISSRKQTVVKNKGVNLKINPHLSHEAYCKIINEGGTISGINTSLQMKNDTQSRLTIHKVGLSGNNNKGVTLSSGVVLPFVHKANYRLC